MEKSASAANGLSLLGSESPFSDSDNMVAMTHLKEEVESLKKLVASKDQQILERDKKVGWITWRNKHKLDFDRLMVAVHVLQLSACHKVNNSF